MQQHSIAAGVYVKTQKLGPVEDIKGIIAPHIEARLEGVEGLVNGYPAGHGPDPDIWWVMHTEEKTIGAYRTSELVRIHKPLKEPKYSF